MDAKAERGTFGQILRRLRLAACLSQAELAERAHMSVASVSALERGRRRAPYRETIRLLSDALGLSESAHAQLEAAAKRPRLHVTDARMAAYVDDRSAGGAEPAREAQLPSRHGVSPASSFVGRTSDIAAIGSLLRAYALVTITGAGGVGKTRVALRIADEPPEVVHDGVYVVELAPLSSGDYVASAVAGAVGVTLTESGDPIASLMRLLKPKRALLVLDNCEHLVATIADMASAILRACPNVKILATSREALWIDGERTYRLPSLDVPQSETNAPLTASTAERYTALALFADRARSVDHEFRLTDANAPVVAEICRRLDGIPLAIELAAARVTILSLTELCMRLDSRLKILSGGKRDAVPRHQTLRATLDWSHDLLDADERALFRRLGAFAAGFRFAGAAAVGPDDGDDPGAIVHVLASLVGKSLVTAEPAGASMRYRLLESTRVYALERVELAGEGEMIAKRHLRYLRDRFVELRDRQETTGRWTEIEAETAAELKDIRAALDWSQARTGPDVVLGAEILASLGFTFEVLGLPSETLRRAEHYLRVLPPAQSRLRAQLLTVVAWLSYSEMRLPRGLEAAQSAIGYARTAGDTTILVEALGAYSWCAMRSLKFEETQRALDEAQAIPGVSRTLSLRLLEYRGILNLLRGDLTDAAAQFEQLREEHRRLANTYERAMVNLLAEVEHARGNSSRAVELVQGVLAESRGHLRSVMLVNLAGYLAAVDDLAAARTIAREAIQLADALNPDDAKVAFAVDHFALVLALEGEHQRAALLSGYADAALMRNGAERTHTETVTYERLRDHFRLHAPAERLRDWLSQGAALLQDDALRIALAGD